MQTNKPITNAFSVKVGGLGVKGEAELQLSVILLIRVLFDSLLEIGEVDESSSKSIRVKHLFLLIHSFSVIITTKIFCSISPGPIVC